MCPHGMEHVPPAQKKRRFRVDSLDHIHLRVVTITHDDRRRDLQAPRFDEIEKKTYGHFCALG
jgi:hypothetical protein